MGTIDTGTTDLLCDITDGVATLTFNRPEAKNALSNPMSQGLIQMLKRCNEDSAVRAILLTGAGGAFCAGGDVKNMGERRSNAITPDERMKEMKVRHRGVGGQIVGAPKPTIAAIAGPAVGADDRDRFTGIEVQIDAEESLEIAVKGLEAGYLQKVCHQTSMPR